MTKSWLKYTIPSIIGTVIGVLGTTTAILWPQIYQSIINTQIALTPTSTIYDLWKETPIPMYLKLYMFNMTNPEDFTSSNKSRPKPNFVQMGPYVFREVDYKVQQVWNNDSTVTFQRRRVWHFDESLSVGSLSDKVTNVNPVTASVAYTLRFKKPFYRDIADRIMKSVDQKLIITKTVNELLFEGFDDTMLRIAKKFNLTKMPFNRFAWFYGRNGSDSYDGTFKMFTGQDNLLKLGILKEWNNDTHVSYYPGTCGEVKGTNGDLWPPLPNNETITFFVPDICTSLTAKYDNETTFEGLAGLRYNNDETILDDGTNVPSRKCYCVGDCIPSGALNISSCKWGAPAFISLPHFYLADPSYRENINGMTPNKEKHELSIALEPKTGVPLNVRAQLQLNLLVQHDSVMSTFKNVKTTFVPMLWFAQEAYLTSSFANTVKFVIILESLGRMTFFGIGFIGTLISSISLFFCVRNSLRSEERQILLATPDHSDINSISE